MYRYFGITERGDASLDTSWIPYVKDFPIVLITKNPLKLYDILSTLDKKDLEHIIVHCTITGLGLINDGLINFEPNVINYKEAFLGLQNIYKLFGNSRSDRIVLRIDPIIPDSSYFTISTKVILDEALFYKKEIKRIRISFIDNYSYLKDRGFHLPWNTFDASLNKRLLFYNYIRNFCIENNFDLEICSESNLPCTGCISEKDIKAVGLSLNDFYFTDSKLKQRPSCECLSIKHELLNNKHPCKHNCVYCYWKKDNEN